MNKLMFAVALIAVAGCGSSTVGGAATTSGAGAASGTSSAGASASSGSSGSSSGNSASSTSSSASSSSSGTSSTSASSSSSTSSSSSSSSSSSGSAASSSSSGSSGSSGSTGPAPLRFAFTGDTRPSSADDLANYPTQVVQQIVASMSTKNIAFALDTGDHVKIGHSDTVADATYYAQQMMDDYTGATAALGKPWYLTMGNHECWDNKNLCDVSDTVLSVFMGYVNQTVNTQQPYYTFDVATPGGTATFVIVADTAWDSTQASWLDAAMTHGDSSAYTIVAKHVPSSNTTDFPTNVDEMAIIEAHKFALLVDSHAHEYSHAGENGREVTLGLGGAPLNNSTDQYGYGLVEQQPDGTLKVTQYVAATDTPLDSFSVQPNQ